MSIKEHVFKQALEKKGIKTRNYHKEWYQPQPALKARIAALGLSQTQFARILGYPRSRIASWFNGITRFTDKDKLAVEKALDVMEQALRDVETKETC